MKNNKLGFSPILIVVIVLLVAVAGFVVYKSGDNGLMSLFSDKSGSGHGEDYSFEKSENGNTIISNSAYGYTFEYPPVTKQSAPSMEILDGSAVSIGFQTEKREKNDASAPYAINFSAVAGESLCEKYVADSAWKQSTINNVSVISSNISGTEVTIFCSGDKSFTFSYNSEYSPQNETELTAEELAAERAAFSTMINSFSIK